MSTLQPLLPELFQLGSYAPQNRTGPALWLRCIDARLVDGAPSKDTTPIFYLPGISHKQLRAADDCPTELTALVELQYRGAVWLHTNGKEWTPYAFLVSKHGGLDLDVAKDQATLDALAGALPSLLTVPVAELQGRLSADYFNELVAPDTTGLLLRWMSDDVAFKQQRASAEWKAFCQQCKTDFVIDPATDSPLKAATKLAARANGWDRVWQRFVEAPANYPGVVEWLKRAATYSLFDSADVWPNINEREEKALQQALEGLTDQPQDVTIRKLAELEQQHAVRRSYPWQKLGLSPLATVLAPLAQLATLCQTSPGAPNPHDYAQFYVDAGWRVDGAAVAAMGAAAAFCTPAQQRAVLGCLRAVYLPWLETTARHLQKLVHDQGQAIDKRAKPIEPAKGRLILFADGLRMDVAHLLATQLATSDMQSTLDWEWSTIPAVTASAKPAASPIADCVVGGGADDIFSTRLKSGGKILTQDRFVSALKSRDWQFLEGNEIGDPTGTGWTEAGTLDKRGHREGWKLSRIIETEVRDMVSRIEMLLKAGWQEIVVVTDHGWLLLPDGLPKVELKAFLTETQWTRCAALKADARTDGMMFKWHWNPTVMMASPPGAGSYRAGIEYSHGGISLQEMVTPVLHVRAATSGGGAARLLDVRWTGAKCRVSVSGNSPGLRIDVRRNQSAPNTSLLTDQHAREVSPDGKVTVFLEDDSDIGIHAEIVLLDASGQVIHVLPTTLGQ